MFYVTSIITYFVFIPGHITAEMFRVTQRFSTVQQVLDNVNMLGVVTAGSTLQMLQVTTFVHFQTNSTVQIYLEIRESDTSSNLEENLF